MDSNLSIILVTPVWNDSNRLEAFGTKLAKALKRADLPVHWVIADDGSEVEEKERLVPLVERFSQIYPSVECISFVERSRKGGAVYRAWDRFEEVDWLAFVDADGAIDADSTIRLIRKALDRLQVCVGVRHNSPDAPVQRRFGRSITFQLFHMLVAGLLHIRFSDTQCGAKVVPAGAYFKIKEQLRERGFVFDVELLLALDRAGYTAQELPLPWREIAGSKIRPLRDAWGMFCGLLRIRNRLKKGHYG